MHKTHYASFCDVSRVACEMSRMKYIVSLVSSLSYESYKHSYVFFSPCSKSTYTCLYGLLMLHSCSIVHTLLCIVHIKLFCYIIGPYYFGWPWPTPYLLLFLCWLRAFKRYFIYMHSTLFYLHSLPVLALLNFVRLNTVLCVHVHLYSNLCIFI